VRCQCVVIAKMFVTKLERCFVDSKLINALGIVYHQFWMQPNVELSFSLHLCVFKRHYCELKRMKPSLDQVVEPLNDNLLNMQ
jgi:hypothetical protein